MKINRGDVWYIENSYAVGSEQHAGRPAIVVSREVNNERSATIEVVYLTTQPKRDLPTHVVIDSTGRRSIAICEQITTVSVQRIGDFKGRVTDEEMAGIDAAMMISLGIAEHDPLSAKLAEAEVRYSMLQQMYDALLDKLVSAG